MKTETILAVLELFTELMENSTDAVKLENIESILIDDAGVSIAAKKPSDIDHTHHTKH